MEEVKEVIDTVTVALADGDTQDAGNAMMQGVNDALLSMGVDEVWADKIDNFIILLLIIGVALLANLICRKIILRTVSKLVKQTKATWDDIVFNDKVMVNLSRMVAPILIYIAIPIAFPEHADSALLDFLRRLCMIYILAVFLRFVSALFTAVYLVYSAREQYKDKPLKGITDRARSFCRCSDVGFQRQYYGLCLRHPAFCQQYAESGRLDYHAQIWRGRHSDRSDLEHRKST